MTRRKPVRAVVFDLDGTLVNSLPLVLASITHALEPFGGKPGMDIFARLGGPPERFLPLLLKDAKHAPEALARMDAYHHANSHLLRAFEGVGPMLDTLRSAGVKTAVWTGRDRLSTEPLLENLGLAARLDTVVCGDDLTSHKPDPAGLVVILGRLGVTPDEALLVGDADVDVIGGRGAGVDTILIRHSREIAQEVLAQSWNSVMTPSEAYDMVVRSVVSG